MKMKMIGAIICVVLMSLCTLTVTAGEEKYTDKFQIINTINAVNKIINKTQENDEHFAHIVGPVSKLYTQVKLEGGLSITNLLVKRNANRRLLRASMFLPFIIIPVENLNFNVTFKKDVADTSRYVYSTFHGDPIYDDDGNPIGFENESEINNTAHTVVVKNFSGLFIFKRARLREMKILSNIVTKFIPDIFAVLPDNHRFLYPARIGFAGFYEDITVSTD